MRCGISLLSLLVFLKAPLENWNQFDFSQITDLLFNLPVEPISNNILDYIHSTANKEFYHFMFPSTFALTPLLLAQADVDVFAFYKIMEYKQSQV
jgi:hypothetical protein